MIQKISKEKLNKQNKSPYIPFSLMR